MKIALLDIETAPNLGWYFDPYKENNIIEVEQEWWILSFAYKWLGQKSVTVRACSDYPGSIRDSAIVHDLWTLLDQADIIIAHNGDRFDLPKINARLVGCGLPPPSPYKTIDTLKICRKYFRFDSNRLDAVAQHLSVGRKLPTTGKDLWLGCARDNKPAAWAMMKRYNAHDVDPLLEGVYLHLRGWATNHPNLNFYTRADACPTCQSQNITLDGFAFSRTGQRQRVQCHECGARSVVGDLIRVQGSAKKDQGGTVHRQDRALQHASKQRRPGRLGTVRSTRAQDQHRQKSTLHRGGGGTRTA